MTVEDRLWILATGRKKEQTGPRGCYVTCVTSRLIQMQNPGQGDLHSLLYDSLHFSSTSPYHCVTLFNPCRQVQLIWAAKAYDV